MSGSNRGNVLVVPGAEKAIDQLKMEIAAELGVPDYATVDKGLIPARIHGAIGGTMTKRLIEMGQLYLMGKDPNQSNLNYQEYRQQAIGDIKEETPRNTTLQ